MIIHKNYKGYRIDLMGTHYDGTPTPEREYYVIMKLKNPQDNSNDPDVVEQLSTEFTSIELALNHVDKISVLKPAN